MLIWPKMAHDSSNRVEMQASALDVFGSLGLVISTKAPEDRLIQGREVITRHRLARRDVFRHGLGRNPGHRDPRPWQLAGIIVQLIRARIHCKSSRCHRPSCACPWRKTHTTLSHRRDRRIAPLITPTIE